MFHFAELVTLLTIMHGQHQSMHFALTAAQERLIVGHLFVTILQSKYFPPDFDPKFLRQIY